MDLGRVLRFLLDRQINGERAVLVTVCSVAGSSMRNPGTIMGVMEDGTYEGSLSGGCIENAVVAEALDVLKADAPRVVRFGAGSPYLDIKLPCGGGMDLHFQPLKDCEFAQACLDAMNAREPFSVRLSDTGAEMVAEWHAPNFDVDRGTGIFGHWPAPKLEIVGHGAGVEALVRIARNLGCETSVLTPDERVAASLKTYTRVTRLVRSNQTNLLEGDPWTAIVFLFHDHDWELDLIARALELPHFYIGAMGGRKAHAMRSEGLIAKGMSAEQIGTIRAPIGVFHSSRDPQTLALSTLSEVIRTYQETDFEVLLG
ncbi:MAG: XdhC family protein [Pseudomonadota bacterium]